MDAITLNHPALTATVLIQHLNGLDAQALSDETRRIYDGAVRISQYDDSKLCAVLDEGAMGEYSTLVAIFKGSLVRVQEFKGIFGNGVFSRREIIPHFASLDAWRSVLSTFRSLHAPPAS